MDTIEVIGYVAGALVVSSMIPQLVKSWKTKSTKDVSLVEYILYVSGIVLWILYAVLIDNGPILFAKILCLLLGIAILILKLRHG